MGYKFSSALLNQAKNFAVGTQFPDFDGYPVTASDSADLGNGPCRAIYVTGGGNVNVNLVGGGTAVLTGLSAGQIVLVQAQRILSTSTTATGVFALY
jgi:hypothetical protein